MKKEFTRTMLKNALGKNLIVGNQYSLPQIKRAIEYPHDISGQGRWHFLRVLNEVCYLVPNTKKSKNYIYNGIVPKMRKVELQDIITETGMYIPYDEKIKMKKSKTKAVTVCNDAASSESVKLQYSKCIRKRIEDSGKEWVTNNDLFNIYFNQSNDELCDLSFAYGKYDSPYISFLKTLITSRAYYLMGRDRTKIRNTKGGSVVKKFLVSAKGNAFARLANKSEDQIINAFFEKLKIGQGVFYNQSNFSGHIKALNQKLEQYGVVFRGTCYEYHFGSSFRNKEIYSDADATQRIINNKFYKVILNEINKRDIYANSYGVIESLFHEWAELRLGIKTELPKLKVGVRPWEKKKE